MLHFISVIIWALSSWLAHSVQNSETPLDNKMSFQNMLCFLLYLHYSYLLMTCSQSAFHNDLLLPHILDRFHRSMNFMPLNVNILLLTPPEFLVLMVHLMICPVLFFIWGTSIETKTSLKLMLSDSKFLNL